ncbi:uncharacterized protein LOC133331240 [Musca vetustissima]|uniref:uncharacterized protein LOC133331240 n=1 Tax=Musca vetustissima TaxID=27455 RepID=UPI002AB7C255|nr:uncharacterized protein LOC133331240 [Musca vetustissima]
MQLKFTVTTIIVLSTFSSQKRVRALRVPSKQTWSYELKSVTAHSDNPDLWSFSEAKAERISRGVYGATLSFDVNFDVIEGDDSEVEMLSYRSENGVKEFKEFPFKVDRQHYFDYFNNFYKLVMDTFRECSNMPIFEDKFQPPFEKKTYILNKCQFEKEQFPQHMQDGFYKVVLNGYGAARWYIELIVEITNEL